MIRAEAGSFCGQPFRGQRQVRGVSLIELMVAVAVVGVLVSMGVPTYSQWLTNGRVRTAAETVQNGLRLARLTAVQRGTPVRFELTAPGAAWTVCVLDDGATDTTRCGAGNEVIQGHAAEDGSTGVNVGTATDRVYATDVSTQSSVGNGVTFGAMGRPLGATPLLRIDASADAAGSRRLVTTLGSGGDVFLCDPALAHSVSPQGCP